MKFKEMPLAHKYCKGKGIEIGAAAHNPFNLDDCINVAPREEECFYKTAQMNLCGEFSEVDYYAYAHKLPFEDSSYDYIITSHVLEHVPDIISTLIEFNRVVRDGGIIFTIIPKRDALPQDKNRHLSVTNDFISAYEKETPDCIEGISRHTWIFSLDSFIGLIGLCNFKFKLGLEVIDTEETDSKVGNGHTIVCKVNK